MEIDNIRTDCYLAILPKFKVTYPDAHFEIITRTAGSALSPTWELLDVAKHEKWDIKKYYKALHEQFIHDPDVVNRLKVLASIARSGKTIFLVCYEKNALICHRTFVKQLLEREIEFGE